MEKAIWIKAVEVGNVIGDVEEAKRGRMIWEVRIKKMDREILTSL